MACDTFLKIAQKCRRHFVQIQVGEAVPFIEEILININTIICDLNPQQVCTVYLYILALCRIKNENLVEFHAKPHKDHIYIFSGKVTILMKLR